MKKKKKNKKMTNKEDVFEKKSCVFILCHVNLSKTLSVIGLCECYVIKNIKIICQIPH